MGRIGLRYQLVLAVCAFLKIFFLTRVTSKGLFLRKFVFDVRIHVKKCTRTEFVDLTSNGFTCKKRFQMCIDLGQSLVVLR